MRIGGQQRMAAGAAARRDGPGVAAGQPRQIGDQLQCLVGQLAGDFHAAKQLEIGVVQQRREQFSQQRIVGAGLNQLEQQPLVLLLADRQTAVVQQIADQQHGLLIPRAGPKAGGPHRQRAARLFHAVVDAFAIKSQLGERAVVQRADFFIEPQMQPGAAEEAIGLDQLRTIEDQLGTAARRHRAGEEHLRRAIDGVQIAEAIERFAPRSGPDMRHAEFVLRDGETASRVLRVQQLHGFGRLGQTARLPCVGDERRCTSRPCRVRIARSSLARARL